MKNVQESPYNPNDPKRQLNTNNITSLDQEVEIIDANTLKERLSEQRTKVLKSDGNTAQVLMYKQATHKTKALTSDGYIKKDWDKIIVYCPLCQGFGATQRMQSYTLGALLVNPAAYTELVGGLPFEDDTIFLHCVRCNLRLLPSVDEVEKLDARTEDEYEITSLADVKRINQKPVIAGQSGRYNKLHNKKEEQLERRKKIAQEQLKTDYQHKKGGDLPKE